MEVLIYPIKSIMTVDQLINQTSKTFLQDLQDVDKNLSFKFIDSFASVKNQLVLILVQSGGSENFFKEQIFKNYDGPYYLLTYGASNSLAAALEILAFIKSHDALGEVLHGDAQYIVERIHELQQNKKMPKERLGVIGKPSDWLIASNVDYDKCLKKFNLELIDIEDQELVELYQEVESNETDLAYDPKELNKALKIQQALKVLIQKYHLDGITIRCFDIIKKLTSTACLALARLNDEGITAICEGDIPTMITAQLLKRIINEPFFQANPQHIDLKGQMVEFAHCTIPFKMCKKYELTTHFESGLGVAIHGELNETDVTIVKIDPEFKLFYLASGALIKNEYREDRCRTQIKVQLKSDGSYFLTSPLANHHLIIYGDHTNVINKYFKALGLIRII